MTPRLPTSDKTAPKRRVMPLSFAAVGRPLVFMGLGAVLWATREFVTASDNLDPSWMEVLHDAFFQPWRFGRDIVFTYGPWGFVTTPLYEPRTFAFVLAFRAVVGATTGWGFWLLLRRAGLAPWLGLLSLVLVLPPALSSDNSAFSLPLVVWFYLGLFEEPDRKRWEVSVFAVVAAGIALTKFTHFVLAGGLVAILVWREVLIRRRFPTAALIFLLALVPWWMLSGQKWGDFSTWITSSIAISGGYTEARAAEACLHPLREIGAFGVVALILVFSVPLSLPSRGRRPLSSHLIPWCGLCFILFLHFKAGFVRHDFAHAPTAMFVLPAMGLLVLLASARDADRRRLIFMAAVVLPVCFAGYAYSLRQYFSGQTPAAHFQEFYGGAFGRLWNLSDLSAAKSALDRDRLGAQAKIRADYPLPGIAGPCDIYSYRQAILYAHGIPYSPRPVIQSYSAYSKSLARLNAGDGDGRIWPPNLLMEAVCIDNRYPSTDDGQSWPFIVANYDVREATGPLVHLVRSERPRTIRRVDLPEIQLRFGEPLELPAHSGQLWAEIEIERTLLGALLAAAFKLPALTVNVDLANGAQADYRLLPAVAAGGLLVSPLIGGTVGVGIQSARAAEDFVRLAHGGTFPASHRVSVIRIRTEWPLVEAYIPKVRLRFYTLNFE